LWETPSVQTKGRPIMSLTSTNPTDDTELMAMLNPVWFNTYWVENALELYDGISQHANELTEHNHFFALVQKFSLDAVVFGICKLFDCRNEQYEKDTIPRLVLYLSNHFTDTYVSRLDTSMLIALGVDHTNASRIVTNFHNHTDVLQTKNDMVEMINKLVPTRTQNPSLEKLFLYRNKVAAHQERLADVVRERLQYLPSTDEIEKINRWASDFCRLMACVLTNVTLLPNGISARMAALNVVAKVLGKNFDPSKGGAAYEEWDTFFRKP
jgi:hypothetical protein